MTDRDRPWDAATPIPVTPTSPPVDGDRKAADDESLDGDGTILHQDALAHAVELVTTALPGAIHLCIAGPVGCGQGLAARLIRHAHGPTAPLVRLSAGSFHPSDSVAAVAALDEAWNEARGGVLRLDELELVLANTTAVSVLSRLRDHVSDSARDSSPPNLVIAGDRESVHRLHALNPALHQLLVHTTVTPFTGEQLVDLLSRRIRREGLAVTPDFETTMRSRFARITGLGNLQNSRIVSALYTQIRTVVTAEGRRLVTPADLDVSRIRLLDIDDRVGFEHLDKLIGLSDVKRTVRLWTTNAALTPRREALGLIAPGAGQHMVFKGPAGTAKTTVARIVSRILAETGALSSGHLVEVDRSDLVADLPEQTTRLVVDAVKRALGGTLFIDEAYSLVSTASGNGRVAIDTLLKQMEDYRDEFVVVAAGYPTEMEQFLSSNPGLRSRFVKVLNFPAYSTDELMAILDHMAAERGFVVAADVASTITPRVALQSQYPGFGNGRHMRNMLDKAIELQGDRLTVDSSDDELCTLVAADFAEAARMRR